MEMVLITGLLAGPTILSLVLRLGFRRPEWLCWLVTVALAAATLALFAFVGATLKVLTVCGALLLAGFLAMHIVLSCVFLPEEESSVCIDAG